MTDEPNGPDIGRELARRIAHEIRTPLGVIRGGVSEVEDREELSAESKAFLALAQRSTGRLERLVRRLEWLARLDEGPSGTAAPLGEVVSAAARDATTYAARRKIDVTLDLAPETAERLVEPADAVQQAIEEVVHNAIRHAVSAVVVGARRDPETWVVSVQHDGAPLESITPPARTDGTSSGLGIGLWLAHALCRAFEARLEVESDAVTVRWRD